MVAVDLRSEQSLQVCDFDTGPHVADCNVGKVRVAQFSRFRERLLDCQLLLKLHRTGFAGGAQHVSGQCNSPILIAEPTPKSGTSRNTSLASKGTKRRERRSKALDSGSVTRQYRDRRSTPPAFTKAQDRVEQNMRLSRARLRQFHPPFESHDPGNRWWRSAGGLWRLHRTTTPPVLSGEAVPPAFDCMTLGATRRFARSLGPEQLSDWQLLTGMFPSRRTPLYLADSGCPLTGPLLIGRCFPVARVSSQPDEATWMISFCPGSSAK